MKLVNKINSKFLGIVVVLFFVGLAIATVAKPHPPGLDEVLAGSKSSFDLNFIFLGLFAVSLTTLTLAKSYEIISRKKSALPARSNKEDILSEENSRLISFNRGLQQENENLKRIRKQLEESLADRMGNEDLLKKSTLNLRRELEKLLAEKEKLTLEANRRNWDLPKKSEPKPAAAPRTKALKKKPKPAAQKRKKR
ncbi:hypothetical protein HZC35_05480 [Candidatus Saganbacteria bacterium]|nr:hypothetical protein [Candidatus Saganbacteria bacterium]